MNHYFYRNLVRLLCFLFIIMGVITDVKAKNLGNLWVIGDSWSSCWIDSTWRRPLYQALIANGYTVDFIGTVSDTEFPGCEVDQEFDRDHDALGGALATDILTELPNLYRELPQADNVLLMAGGNDITDHSDPAEVSRVLGIISDIITSLRTDNSHVKVYLGAYAYAEGIDDAEIDAINLSVKDLAGSLSTTQSPVYYADLRPDWDKNIHLLPPPDGHPNAAGMAVLANNWFNAIQANNNSGGGESGANVNLEVGLVEYMTTEWATVYLCNMHESMVVIAMANYNKNMASACVRIKNAQDSSFRVRIDGDGNTEPDYADIYYLAVEEGGYTEANDGITLEGVKHQSTITDNSSRWVGQPQSYVN